MDRLGHKPSPDPQKAESINHNAMAEGGHQKETMSGRCLSVCHVSKVCLTKWTGYSGRLYEHYNNVFHVQISVPPHHPSGL